MDREHNGSTGDYLTGKRANKCARATSADAAARAQVDATCRHRRKGAIREKRSASAHSPRAAFDRADNAYANAANKIATAGKLLNTPLIDFAAVGEDLLMRPINPVDEPADDAYEFPAYVPWKAVDFPEKTGPAGAGLAARETAAVRANRRNNNDCGRGTSATATSMCEVCQKCRCTVCQRMCEYPPVVTVCNAHVESDPWWLPSWLPCVNKTTRCIAAHERYTRERRAAAVSAAAAVAAAAANKARQNASDARPTSRKWKICALLCACCPCLSRRPTAARDGGGGKCALSRPANAKCVENCYGNVNVERCYCVDWKMWKKIRGHCKSATDSGPRRSDP